MRFPAFLPNISTLVSTCTASVVSRVSTFHPNDSSCSSWQASDMCPSIMNQYLHLINEAVRPRFATAAVPFCPPFYSVADDPLLEPNGSHPTLDAVSPEANESVVEGRPGFHCMNGGIGAGVVANADAGVQPDAVEGRLRVVGVDETAFRALKVMGRERVGDAAEPEWVGSVERGGVEGYYERIRPICARCAEGTLRNVARKGFDQTYPSRSNSSEQVPVDAIPWRSSRHAI